MSDLLDTGKEVKLNGKSGLEYTGKIYSKSDIFLAYPVAAYLCWCDSPNWENSIKKVTKSQTPNADFKLFCEDESFTHLIVIPKEVVEFGRIDKLEDIETAYI